MKRILLGALAALLLVAAGARPAAAAAATQVIAGASKHVASSTLTRPANTTAYGGTASVPVAICAATSGTICAPLTFTVSPSGGVNGYVTSMRLEKSTTGASAASFQVLLYEAAPTLTSTFDTTAYSPVAADVVSGAFVGYWTCASQVVNAASSTYECTSTTNSGNQAFSLADTQLRAVVTTTGAYVPGSNETFTLIADILASAP